MMTAEGLTIEPDAVFGMLLAAEGGASLDQVAHVYGMSRDSVADLLAQARRGECGRVEASTGDAKVPMHKGTSSHGPIASDKQEVLVKRWMRRVARHLHRHGSITRQQLRDLMGEGDVNLSISLGIFHQQLSKLGINFTSGVRKGTLPNVLELDLDSQNRLAAIIAADWKIEVNR
jgi:hypothetical protein